MECSCFSCVVCGRCYSQVPSVLAHLLIRHPTHLLCNSCKLPQDNQEVLTSHEAACSKTRPYFLRHTACSIHSRAQCTIEEEEVSRYNFTQPLELFGPCTSDENQIGESCEQSYTAVTTHGRIRQSEDAQGLSTGTNLLTVQTESATFLKPQSQETTFATHHFGSSTSAKAPDSNDTISEAQIIIGSSENSLKSNIISPAHHNSSTTSTNLQESKKKSQASNCEPTTPSDQAAKLDKKEQQIESILRANPIFSNPDDEFLEAAFLGLIRNMVHKEPNKQQKQITTHSETNSKIVSSQNYHGVHSQIGETSADTVSNKVPRKALDPGTNRSQSDPRNSPEPQDTQEHPEQQSDIFSLAESEVPESRLPRLRYPTPVAWRGLIIGKNESEATMKALQGISNKLVYCFNPVVLTHLRRRDILVHCSCCKIDLDRMDYFTTHVEDFDQVLKCGICVICGNDILDMSFTDYVSHVRLHFVRRLPTMSHCSGCKGTFFTSFNRNAHYRTKHAKPSPLIPFRNSETSIAPSQIMQCDPEITEMLQELKSFGHSIINSIVEVKKRAYNLLIHCTVCSRDVDHDQYFTTHLFLCKHKNVFHCFMCGGSKKMEFSDLKMLLEHLFGHFIASFRFLSACKECPGIFYNDSTHKHHALLQHSWLVYTENGSAERHYNHARKWRVSNRWSVQVNQELSIANTKEKKRPERKAKRRSMDYRDVHTGEAFKSKKEVKPQSEVKSRTKKPRLEDFDDTPLDLVWEADNSKAAKNSELFELETMELSPNSAEITQCTEFSSAHFMAGLGTSDYQQDQAMKMKSLEDLNLGTETSNPAQTSPPTSPEISALHPKKKAKLEPQNWGNETENIQDPVSVTENDFLLLEDTNLGMEINAHPEFTVQIVQEPNKIEIGPTEIENYNSSEDEMETTADDNIRQAKIKFEGALSDSEGEAGLEQTEGDVALFVNEPELMDTETYRYIKLETEEVVEGESEVLDTSEINDVTLEQVFLPSYQPNSRAKRKQKLAERAEI